MYIFIFLSFFIGGFASEYNFAPKVKNPQLEKPLVLVICSYNNEKYYKGNLDSVFSQKYENYRVIYVNDASKDRTGDLVQKYIVEHGVSDKVTYIENKTNQNAMSNQYKAIHSCRNEEVVVIFDGDDQFTHSKVFERINQAYAVDRVWVTYGDGKGVLSKPFKRKILLHRFHRKKPFLMSAPRTFYAGLFKLIPSKRFMIRNEFIPVTSDAAIMFNLVDLAKDHVYFITDHLYNYNNKSPINDFRVRGKLQYKFFEYLARQRPLPYYCINKEDFI